MPAADDLSRFAVFLVSTEQLCSNTVSLGEVLEMGPGKIVFPRRRHRYPPLSVGRGFH